MDINELTSLYANSLEDSIDLNRLDPDFLYKWDDSDYDDDNLSAENSFLD